MKGMHTGAVLIVIILLMAASSKCASAQSRYNICVRYNSSAPISSPEVSSITSRMQTIVSSQASEDCRRLSISAHSTSQYTDEYPLSLTRPSELEQFRVDDCIKVVRIITWCGEGTLPKGGALGCSKISGQGIVAVRSYPGFPQQWLKDVEPVTWLHELGHTRGLQHNVIESSDLMTAGISPSTNIINTRECKAYSGTMIAAPAVPRGVSSQAESAIPVGVGDPEIEPAQPSTVIPDHGTANRTLTRVPVEEFVRQNETPYPVEKAKSYSDELKHVTSLLKDKKFFADRNGVIALLSVIGTKETVAVLTDLIKSDILPSSNDSEVYARLASLTAIGTIIQRLELPDHYAEILRISRDPEFWRQHLKGYPRSDVDFWADLLATQATKGYALTGLSSAFTELQRNRVENAGAAIPAPLQNARDADLQHFLALNRKSKVEGALATFQ